MQLVLLGFGNLQDLKYLIFVLFLICYVIIIFGNSLVISLITANKKLHSPMYFFLCNLSICEILFTTIFLPNILYVIWGNGGSISFYGCITQLYLGASVGSGECLFLTVMAYDRYLAICNPLRYSSIMNNKMQNHLSLCSWLPGFIAMAFLVISLCNLKYCGSNIIDHVLCDLGSFLQLSSTDTYLVEIVGSIVTFLFNILPLILIILSYVSIFFTILRIPSRTSRQKSFSTCSSHLASVFMYFGTICIIYLVPSQQHSFRLNKILSLLYSVGNPLLNPMIYSLRNREMKSCIVAYFAPKA
ncbi:unnamed protein product [Staurois parvus]|uniref:Olfactory receptor n=1 Tax=Staurois parvus TaxID=386267 RepID=A0ABN9HF97_9NEOB|nr:unnamed protein product [Staurois parvus]